MFTCGCGGGAAAGGGGCCTGGIGALFSTCDKLNLWNTQDKNTHLNLQVMFYVQLLLTNNHNPLLVLTDKFDWRTCGCRILLKGTSAVFIESGE